ncbi:ABC transporter permease [Candidatus Atelocyanobacterium thalassae]|uniref:Dipeptide transport system permease protein DppB n=1 Tax=cyanobacterium endosymbiont of Braarudosphaera bigelowii TaxID=1285375 RepID=A0ABM7UCT5_9CHRO|nr:ABC transporter permease [Candidatus Atelocyanobacterium thalassa]BDA40259.1 dipeptide transport system permease protein DppB [cyanobacterium endosymbiont of Braarudosphaera bigelowii]
MSRLKAIQNYVLVRLLIAPVMIWTIVTLVFLLLRVATGDPADAILGNRAPEFAKENLRETLGLNQPLWFQYLSYLKQLLFLNLGNSIVNQGQPVWKIITEHFPATAELTIYSMIIAIIIGIIAGTISALNPNTVIDLISRLFGIISYSLPIFWVGMVFQLIFAVQLKLLPLGTRFPLDKIPPDKITGIYTIDSLLNGNVYQFFTSAYHLILPCITLGLLLSGIFERTVRLNLRYTLQTKYVEAARARGITEYRIILFYALKNALIPVVTILGLVFSSLLGGAVLTEVTFSWPGLGNSLYQAIAARDYTTVQGIIVFFSVIVVSVSILVDLVNAYIDPRIKY